MAGTDEEAVIVAQHRATDRFKEAWKIISPKPEHRAECEYDLVRALLTIPVAVGLDKSKPAENKKKPSPRYKEVKSGNPRRIVSIQPGLVKCASISVLGADITSSRPMSALLLEADRLAAAAIGSSCSQPRSLICYVMVASISSIDLAACGTRRFGQRVTAPSGLSPFLSTATAIGGRSHFQCDTQRNGSFR